LHASLPEKLVWLEVNFNRIMIIMKNFLWAGLIGISHDQLKAIDGNVIALKDLDVELWSDITVNPNKLSAANVVDRIFKVMHKVEPCVLVNPETAPAVQGLISANGAGRKIAYPVLGRESQFLGWSVLQTTPEPNGWQASVEDVVEVLK